MTETREPYKVDEPDEIRCPHCSWYMPKDGNEERESLWMILGRVEGRQKRLEQKIETIIERLGVILDK
jgi:hypothetical protein